jgi:hypothetical protein
LSIRCWSSRKIHLRLLQQSEKYELVGFYDPNQENADKISKEFGYKHFSTIATLIHAVDVIDCNSNSFPLQMCKSCFFIAFQKREAALSGKYVDGLYQTIENVPWLYCCGQMYWCYVAWCRGV